MKILSPLNKWKAKNIVEKKKINTTELFWRCFWRRFSLKFSYISFSKHTYTPHLPIFPTFHIAADAWNQLPADIRTSSSLLKFKDSTRHYTGLGRQLPSVTTVAVSCFQIAYLGLLNYMCLLKLCSISLTQTSTFLSRKQRGLLVSVCLQPSAVGDMRREREMERAQSFFQLRWVALVITVPLKWECNAAFSPQMEAKIGI